MSISAPLLATGAADIGAEELEIFSDVLKKMQENMELTEKGAGYG